MLSTSPRDPFSTPCEKVIPEPYSHQPRPEIPSRLPARSNSRAIVSRSHHKYPVLVVSIGIQLRVSFTVGPAIDSSVLPCRGAPTYPPHSLNSGWTRFLGHARPRPNDTLQPYLQLSREVPVGLILCARGSWPSPLALRIVAYMVKPGTNTTGRRRSVRAAMLNWTSDRAFG